MKAARVVVVVERDGARLELRDDLRRRFNTPRLNSDELRALAERCTVAADRLDELRRGDGG